MELSNLPNEILLRIAWFVPRCPTCKCRHHSHDLFALSRCSHHLHSLLTPHLAGTACPMQILLWAIWHNRPDTATWAMTLGASVNSCINETHYVGHHTSYVHHGTPLSIAFRNRLRNMDPAARQLAFELCALFLDAGGIPCITELGAVVDAGDTALLRMCLPHITDINERTNPRGETLLKKATIAGHDAIVALLLPAGASMVGSDGYRPYPHGAGPSVRLPMDRSTADIRVVYPGWDHSTRGNWDAWGPVCMLPGILPGCTCPWCPREITGGHSEFAVVELAV